MTWKKEREVSGKSIKYALVCECVNVDDDDDSQFASVLYFPFIYLPPKLYT